MTATTHSSDDDPSRRNARSGLWIFVIVAVIMLTGGGWLLKVAKSTPVAEPIARSVAGEPIASIGEYRSPDGNTLLILMETVDARGIIVEAKYQAKPQASARWQIDASQPWQFTFGEDGSVWGYSSDQGPHSWRVRPDSAGLTIIGIGGGWQGMPESFLASLPQEHRDVHAEWLAAQNVARQP